MVVGSGEEGVCIQYLARVTDVCDSEAEGGKRRGERGDDGETVGASLRLLSAGQCSHRRASCSVTNYASYLILWDVF